MKRFSFMVWLFILFLYNHLTFGQPTTPKHVVNILTWWGYLNSPEIINGAENQCGTNISFDQYYSNDEFLRRWREQKNSYDIIIFSNTIYNNIRSEIKNINISNLWKLSNTYNPIIKSHYLKSKYPNNIVYFIHSLTGFLYNPNNIQLNSTDSTFMMFKKSKNKIVVLVDDPAEARKLEGFNFKNLYSYNKHIVNLKDFKNLYQQSVVYIGNGFNQIYQSENFSFGFVWSGEGIEQTKDINSKLKFLIHPKLSYISSDLLAQTKNNKLSECVSNYLSSEKTLKIIENNNYYFSSYANSNNINNIYFRNTYNKFIHLLPKLQWIDSIQLVELDSMNKSWDLIKLYLLNNKNES